MSSTTRAGLLIVDNPTNKGVLMSAVDNVLVIGAGLAGTACAIRLAQAGVVVDLVDR